MVIFLLLLVVVVTLFLCHCFNQYGRIGRKLRNVPELKTYPILGHVTQFSTTSNTELWNLIRKATKTCYPVSKFWTMNIFVVNVSHPDDLEILLSSRKIIEKNFVYDFLHPWLQRGLLTSAGDLWHQRRKILTPAFHFNVLKKYMSCITNYGNTTIKSLKCESKETVKELISFCSNVTLNIICEAAMGIKLDEIDTKTSSQYIKAVHDYGKIMVYRTPRPYLATWMMPLIFGSLYKKTISTLHTFTNKIIQDRKEYHTNTQNKYLNELDDEMEEKTNYDITAGGKKKRLAMLDLLLKEEMKGTINLNGIKEEVDTFTFEGHDTTGMAMMYSLLLLAENTEAQNKARIEVTEIIDKSDSEIGMSEIQDMDYLDRCIKESLRLFPPVSTILRHAHEDIQLKHVMVPAGSDIMVHFFDTHRDPNFWSNPDKYDPDRFLPENSVDRHPFAYVPFSAGPRNCIGRKFAMLELKSTISRILYDFYLEPITRLQDIQIMADIIMRPADPVYIKFIRISK